ncbi:MAG: UDP-N-acetylmuramate dehydrogenase [Clostridia bacterium]|nr:UDP-N-acetylmuramate dehydrogenase [Clostridia bacterium]
MDEFSSRIHRLGVRIFEGVSGRSLTTFGSGGAVRYLALPHGEEEILSVIAAARDEDIPYRVIGGGSNVLLPDRGYDGLLVKLPAEEPIRRVGNLVTVGAGVKMPALARFLSACGLSGAEFACGIPGTMGGAAAVNAGAFGQSLSDLLVEIRAVSKDGERVVLYPRDLDYGYHRASVPEGAILSSMTLRLTESEEGTIKQRMREMRERRSRTQPREPSAGSVFRRVGETPAAIYVEGTGLKGTRIGGALLSPVHCNFIVNTGGATSEEYFALAEKVRESVKALYGVLPEYEVERIC